jgi:hypothetical protein
MPRSLLLAAGLLFVTATTAIAQPRRSAPPPQEQAEYKNPGVATAIAVGVPGGGHIYAGETAKGLGTLFVSVAAVSVGALYSECYTPRGGGDTRCNYVPLYIGLGVHGGNWLLSLLDAGDAARRHNRRAGLRSAAQVTPLVALNRTEPSYGVRVSVQF